MNVINIFYNLTQDGYIWTQLILNGNTNNYNDKKCLFTAKLCKKTAISY